MPSGDSRSPVASSGTTSGAGAAARRGVAHQRDSNVVGWTATTTSASHSTATAACNVSGNMDGGAAACTRAALKSVVEMYFTAMAAHDPSTLKAASTVKFTENAKALKLGEGLWKTAGAVAFHRDVLDTERCAAVSEAVVDNQGTATIFGLRLKLDAAQVTEVETIVVDPKNGFFPTPNGIVNRPRTTGKACCRPIQRSSRAELTAAANAYFDLFSNSSAMVPFGKPCNRLENGLQNHTGDCGTGIPAGNLMMTHRSTRSPISKRGSPWVGCSSARAPRLSHVQVKGGKIQSSTRSVETIRDVLGLAGRSARSVKRSLALQKKRQLATSRGTTGESNGDRGDFESDVDGQAFPESATPNAPASTLASPPSREKSGARSAVPEGTRKDCSCEEWRPLRLPRRALVRRARGSQRCLTLERQASSKQQLNDAAEPSERCSAFVEPEDGRCRAHGSDATRRLRTSTA